MATSSVRNHPNFAVICSFLQRYGEQLRLPDLTIPELEEVLEATNFVGHGLKELIITLMKRVVNSVKPDRWEKHLIKLIENYHSPVDAFELESLGFSLCKLETKLSILKYLCETQFDDNPKFKNLVNKEIPVEQKLKPIGRDKLGLVYWFQKDYNCNLRIYREEQDDIDETTWQTVGRNREDLANLIYDLKGVQSTKLPLDSLESSRSATPILTNGDTNATKLGSVKQENDDVGGEGERGGIGAIVKTEDDAVDTKHDQRKEEIEIKGIEKLEGAKSEESVNVQHENDKNSTQNDDKCSASQKEGETGDNGVPKEAADSTRDEDTVKPTQDDEPKVKSEQVAGSERSAEETRVKKEEKSDDKELVGDEKGVGDQENVETKEAALTGGDAKHKTPSEDDQEKSLENDIRAKDSEKQTDKENDGKQSKTEREDDGRRNSTGKIETTKIRKEGKELKIVERTENVPEENDIEKMETDMGTKETTKEITKIGDGVAGETEESNKDGELRGRKAKKGKTSGETAKEFESEVERKTGGDEETKNENEERGTATDAVKKSVKKNRGGGGKRKATKGSEVSSKEGEANEVRWSRRLRVRKPPPTKEETPVVEEEETPKKKTKTGKKNDVKVEKKSGRKKKKQEESEEEEESEDEEEEKEEVDSEEIEEKDNSSDEDFLFKEGTTKNAANDTAPPVKKARTATCTKKSKSHSKKTEPEELSDEPCIKCGNYNHPTQILLCDSCDAGYHTACLRPPLMFVPDGQWFCPTCEHVMLLKNLEATLVVVDGELKILHQKNRKKHDKFQWLLTEVCPANILPEETSVLITKRIEKIEKPERLRHERTRPQPRKVVRAYIDEPDEIEYIQRRSGRNRKQINYKFEEFDTAINSAISEEVEEKRKAIAQGGNVVYGQSRGKDMSTIEAAHWEEEENESNARKRKKKLNDLEDTSEEEEEDESDEFTVNIKERASDGDFVADDDEATSTEEEEEEEEEEACFGRSDKSDSGSEYGRKEKKGSQGRRRKARGKRKDLGPIRRSSRNLGKERLLYRATSSSESDEDRPRNAWRMNPIITARRQRLGEDDHHKRRRMDQSSSDSSESDGDPSFGEKKKNGGQSRRSVTPDVYQRKKKKRRKQKEESSSTEDEEEDGYVQPKRKFRIDSDDSGEGGGKSDDNQKEIGGKGSDGPNDKNVSEITRKKVNKTLRGMHTRVDYRKMADGSSSEDGGGEGGGKSGDVETEGETKRGNDRDPISDEDEEEEDKADLKAERTDVSESPRPAPAAKSIQKNSTTSVNDDDDSLSPISDLEDLKENGTLQNEKVQATVVPGRTDKKSAEDDDDLEGVTDIFDYLSKD